MIFMKMFSKRRDRMESVFQLVAWVLKGWCSRNKKKAHQGRSDVSVCSELKVHVTGWIMQHVRDVWAAFFTEIGRGWAWPRLNHLIFICTRHATQHKCFVDIFKWILCGSSQLCHIPSSITSLNYCTSRIMEECRGFPMPPSTPVLPYQLCHPMNEISIYKPHVYSTERPLTIGAFT